MRMSVPIELASARCARLAMTLSVKTQRRRTRKHEAGGVMRTAVDVSSEVAASVKVRCRFSERQRNANVRFRP
jgi:hypothetical protein